MRAVGLDEPFFVRRGEGAYLEDEDGNRYVDWVHVVGAADLRPRRPARRSRRSSTRRATAPRSAPRPSGRCSLAEEIVDAVPSIEQVRLVSSGTEAAMSAIRLARGFTRRDRILKFAGCYHGHADALLASAGSGLATLGIPSSPGVPPRTTGGHDRLPVQRRRGGRRGGRALRRGPRGDPRRAGRREHGRRPAGARLPRGAPLARRTRRARCSSSTR